MPIGSALFSIALLSGSSSGQMTVFAVCGASEGVVRYIEPRDTGWTDDAVTNGSIMLIESADGKPDILTRDAMGQTVAVSSGSVVLAPLIDEDSGTFLFVTIDNERNEVVTYNVTTDAAGSRTLLWTDNKVRKTNAGITKAAAFIAKCESSSK